MGINQMNISKDTLELYLDDCRRNNDTQTTLLIECILESYKQVDAERVQKIAAVRASSEILAESRKKDIRIADLMKSIDQQNESLQSAISAFRKIYEISIFGNNFFKAEPLLRLWIAIEKFVSSKNQTEFTENNIELMSVLSSLGEDSYLIDMRNNMVNFRAYMEQSNGEENEERESDTTRDNA